MAVPFITRHAIIRYQQRVDAAADTRAALRAIRAILATAKVRSRPRHWTSVDARPGCRYLYSAHHPGICLVLAGNAVVTVFSRRTCHQWRQLPGAKADARPATRSPYRRLSHSEWTPWGGEAA